MSEHKYVTHKTYTGPGCAMCGKSEVEHVQPAEVNYRDGVTEGVEPRIGQNEYVDLNTGTRSILGTSTGNHPPPTGPRRKRGSG